MTLLFHWIIAYCKTTKHIGTLNFTNMNQPFAVINLLIVCLSIAGHTTQGYTGSGYWVRKNVRPVQEMFSQRCHAEMIFPTISFGIQKNSGPPAECNDFYNFKIVGDKKHSVNLAFTWGKPSRDDLGMTSWKQRWQWEKTQKEQWGMTFTSTCMTQGLQVLMCCCKSGPWFHC